MIPRTRLIRSDLSTSRLGFGCSRLHYLADAKTRLALLGAAFDLGFRHFDVAPSYGHGINERALGDFLRARRSSCTVATKFGLKVSPIVDLASMVSSQAARTVLGVRSLVRRVVPTSSHVENPTTALLEQEVSRSLRRLRTDHIDVHFLHDPIPGPGSVAAIRALLPTYRKMQSSGIIGRIGLSGDFGICRSLWTELNVPDILLQVPEADWTEDCPPDFSFGTVISSGQSYFAQARPISSDVESRIRYALERRSRGVVLVSTSSLDHLQSLASAAEDVRLAP